MTQWYCGVQGNQYGPVDDATVRAWIAQGRITAGDVVWCDGMSEWRPAAEQFPDMFQAGGYGVYAAAGAGGAAWAGPGLVPAPPPGGTDGTTPNAELTAQARALLSGRWGLPIGFCVLAWLIQSATASLPYIGPLVQLVFIGALQLGVIVFFLTFVRGGRGDLGMLFAGFKKFGAALCTVLLRTLMILGWALLTMGPGLAVVIYALVRIFILLDEYGDIQDIWSTDIPMLLIVGGVLAIPGQVVVIIKQLSYSQALYVVADEGEVGAMDAIRQSVQIMRGKKGKLFLLGLRFFGWGLLCILTLYVGFLWLVPYMNTTFARFYDDLQPPRQVKFV